MLSNLMFQSADHYRPTPGVDQTNSEYLGTDTLVASSVPVNIQPASSRQIEFYAAFRSMEISHTIYTEHAGPWQRNDVLIYGGRRFTIIGVRNAIELNRLYQLDVLEYMGANPRQ